MTKKTITKLKAVHDIDLEGLLDSLGLSSSLRAGKLKCAFCKEVITFENLHSIFPDSGAIKVSCSNPDCVKTLMARMEEKQYGNNL
jgi:hypothetical protein